MIIKKEIVLEKDDKDTLKKTGESLAKVLEILDARKEEIKASGGNGSATYTLIDGEKIRDVVQFLNKLTTSDKLEIYPISYDTKGKEF